MDRPLEVGDLVQVAYTTRCCHHETGYEGYIFTITAIIDYGPAQCKWCPDIKNPVPSAAGISGNLVLDIDTLKRISPLSELESVKQTEEIPA